MGGVVTFHGGLVGVVSFHGGLAFHPPSVTIGMGYPENFKISQKSQFVGLKCLAGIKSRSVSFLNMNWWSPYFEHAQVCSY